MPERISYHSALPNVQIVSSPEAAAIKTERDRFYSSARWRKLRAAFLAKNPLCVRCQARGDTTLARVAHHVKERLDFPALAYSMGNLEALCSPCHTSKHNREV